MYKVVIEYLPYSQYYGKHKEGWYEASRRTYTYEFESKEEAFEFYERNWRLTDFLYWIGENNECVYARYHDEFYEASITLYKWDGFEKDVDFSYKIPKDWKNFTCDFYSFRSLSDAYLKACELHGKTPVSEEEEIWIDDDGTNTCARIGISGFGKYVGWIFVNPLGELEEKVKVLREYKRSYFDYLDSLKKSEKPKPEPVVEKQKEVKDEPEPSPF